MKTLYHLVILPEARAARVALAEKSMRFDLVAEPVWERREAFLALNPAGEVPVLVDEDGTVIAGFQALIGYLEDVHPDPALIPGSAAERAEIRRLADWFQTKFAQEVTDCLVGEKILKRFLGRAMPSSEAIRAGCQNIHTHLSYISYLVERRKWLAGDHFSIADILAACHLSSVDYLGDVPWGDHGEAKEWYARVKSRPTFRPLLADRIPGLNPPVHYVDLDF
ncbi:MAG: glutathione S-transferase family protein [Magnetovibrionaceae bacterium]